jgi:hypothetical protein
MLVYVYKSLKKLDTYLYVPKKADFTALPEALFKTFGPPKFVMILALDKREKLAIVDKQKLREQLAQKGFYLQIPPPTQNLLKQHLADNEAAPNVTKLK